MSKNQKQAKVKFREGMSMDRISDLPDPVLSHILSFLPTKHAVGTSILSTRWKFLYASVSNLDFDDSLLLNHQLGDDRNEVGIANMFMNFVDRVLFSRNVSIIDKFSLKCEQAFDSGRISGWIWAALRHNVRELDLHITIINFRLLSFDLLTCKTLVVLKLGWQFFLNIPSKVCLPNLKILHLDSIKFWDENSTQRLFSSCPVLEDLVVMGCEWETIRKFKITSPTLKRLTIDYLSYEIVVDAPSLVYFKYADYVTTAYSLINLHSLVEAHIDLLVDMEYYDGYAPFCDATTKLFRGISNVQSLYIPNYALQVLQICVNPLPVFHKMTHLRLRVCQYFGWKPLLHLLKTSPCLENLVFEGPLYDREYGSHGDELPCHWFQPDHCLLFNLKAIEFQSFQGNKAELRLVRFFLKNAKVLGMFTIHIHVDMKEKELLEITKHLLMLPRASDNCQIVIV